MNVVGPILAIDEDVLNCSHSFKIQIYATLWAQVAAVLNGVGAILAAEEDGWIMIIHLRHELT